MTAASQLMTAIQNASENGEAHIDWAPGYAEPGYETNTDRGVFFANWNGKHIRDGDMVVYEDRSNPRNGDTVVALVDGEEATLKKFYKEKNRVRLQPANAAYKPIYTRNVQIQGVVIGVIRRY